MSKINSESEDTQKFIAQQLVGQQLQQIEQQISTIDLQTKELTDLKDNLKELKNYSKKIIHTSIGAGIFLESELKNTDDVLLNVGAGVIIKKDTESAIKIIENQIEELKSIQSQMQSEFERLLEGLKELK